MGISEAVEKLFTLKLLKKTYHESVADFVLYHTVPEILDYNQLIIKGPLG